MNSSATLLDAVDTLLVCIFLFRIFSFTSSFTFSFVHNLIAVGTTISLRLSVCQCECVCLCLCVQCSADSFIFFLGIIYVQLDISPSGLMLRSMERCRGVQTNVS